MVVRFSVLVAAALALSACNKPGTEKAPAPVAKPAAGPAAMPTRKPGLWKQTVVTSGMTQDTSICIDPAVEAKISVWGAQMGKSVCQQTSMVPAPGGWTFSSACEMGTGGKITSTGKISGDFNSSYTVETQSQTDGAAVAHMNGKHTMALTAVWQGPCPADMKPGDMTLPGGMKINMLDMAK